MKWKKLSWLDPRYEVSDTGLVRSCATSKSDVFAPPRKMKPRTDKDGYLKVAIRVNKRSVHCFVHRLVLRAFTGVEGVQSNHKNGKRADNRRSNLAWCTSSENVLHSYRVLKREHPRGNLGRTGAAHWGSKPVVQLSLGGVRLQVWASASDAERIGGFSRAVINRVCTGKGSTSAGFKWQYLQTTQRK